jgi:hypothetical protein
MNRHTHIPQDWLNLNIKTKTVRALCGAQTTVFGIPGVNYSEATVQKGDKRWFAWCPRCVDIFVPDADAFGDREDILPLVQRVVSVAVSVVYNQYVAQQATETFPAQYKFRAR